MIVLSPEFRDEERALVREAIELRNVRFPSRDDALRTIENIWEDLGGNPSDFNGSLQHAFCLDDDGNFYEDVSVTLAGRAVVNGRRLFLTPTVFALDVDAMKECLSDISDYIEELESRK